jgi:hypothetical protein
MAGIIFSASAGLNDSKLGKIAEPLRAVIYHESDLNKKSDELLDVLYNVEKSNRFGEAVQYQDEYGTFDYTPEGGRFTNDSIVETRRKFIEHVPFGKTFEITRQMYDDANYGPSSDMKQRAQLFTRAYYATRIDLATKALVNAVGDTTKIVYNGATVDLTCADDLALFNNKHLYGSEAGHGQGVQSNHLFSKRAASADISVEEVLEMIEAGAMQIRNMKDENGEVTGYTADTIIIPGNLRKLERAVKQALGSEYNPSDSTNAINVQCGNWRLIVLPKWQAKLSDAQEYPMIIQSSEAKRNLCGSMFYNRVDLEVDQFVDPHTKSLVFSGYCRFGLGFPTYKHIVRVKSVASTETPSDADAI